MKLVKKYIISFILFMICIFPFSVKAENINRFQIRSHKVYCKHQWEANHEEGIYLSPLFYKGTNNQDIGILDNHYYTDSHSLFCIDSHLNGPADEWYIKEQITETKLQKAYLVVYNYFIAHGGKNATNPNTYLTANTASRLITLQYVDHYYPTKVGTQFNDGDNSQIPIYSNTLTIVNDLLQKGNYSFQNYKNANATKSIMKKGISGKTDAGDGILSNAIDLYIEAKKKYEESSNTKSSKINISVTNTNNIKVSEINNNYVAEFTVQASGFNTSDGEYSNPKVEKIGNTYTSIEFVNPPSAGTKYDKTSTFTIRAIISKDQASSVGSNKINILFNFSFDYAPKYNPSNVFFARPEIATSTRQRMIVFNNEEIKETEKITEKLTVTIELPICQIKEKEDGTKEYYDENGALINKGSEAENEEEYNQVCKPCFKEDSELDPNSPNFNKEMFDHRGCCNAFDPNNINADPGHKEYYDKFCARACYVTPELNPDSGEFNEEIFKEECCDTPPTNIIQQEYYNTYCVKDPCDPVISAPTYCATSQTITIKESDDFDRCILNNTDAAGNSYNLEQQGLLNNPYCKVACKEDYTINLPSMVPQVKAGQYFVLKTDIQGTRTCKSSEINQTKFESDIRSLNQKVIDAYNAWAKANAYEKATAADTSSYSENYNTGCQKTTTENEDGTTSESCDGGTSTSCSVTTRKYNIPAYTEFSYNRDTDSITSREVPAETTGWYGSVSTTNCDCNGTSGSCSTTSAWSEWTEDKKAELYNDGKHSSLQDYKNDLTEALNDLDQAFYYQNACTTWENDYQPEPIITYDYDEDYYMDYIIKNDNQFVLEGELKFPKDEEEYCDDFTCLSTYKEQKNVTSISCSALTGSKACKINTRKVNDSAQISKIKTYSATYKPKMTFYTKYPTGAIIGRTDGRDQPGYTKLGKVFPVALTTPEGNYEYTLNYLNIGQFNDREQNNQGRLTASEDNYGNNVYDALGYSNEYVCNYNVVEDICLECFPNPGSNPNPNPSGGGTLPGGFAYFYRPISLYDVFPNSKVDTSPRPDYMEENATRTIGKNWTSVKGVFTQKKIEENNALAYEKAEYSFTLTPANMMAIRNYNKTHQYNDFNLTCDKNGIDCRSAFLRDEGYFSDAKLNETFIHVNGEGNTPKGLEICNVGETNNLSCVGPSWK